MFARWAKRTATVFLVVICGTIQFIRAEDEYSYRANVDEVRLTLVATDRQNRYVTDLASNDLAIVDNETIVRRFRSFSKIVETRLNVLVLIDGSRSINGHQRLRASSIVDSIRGASWGDSDAVSVLTFGAGAPSLTCARNCPSEAPVLVDAPSGGEGVTELYDFVRYGADLLSLKRAPESKSVLIIATDGLDNHSRASLSQAVSSLQRTDVTAYAIDLNGRGFASDGSPVLQRIAHLTGGITFSIDDGPARILHNVLSDLRSSYVLTYVPPVNSEGPHAVQVLPTRNLSLTFRSRQGYVYNHTGEETKASR